MPQGDLKFVPFTELPDAPANPWLVTDFLARAALAVIAGAPKAGKSLFALELAVSVATGLPFLGRFPVATTGPVLYLPGEGTAASIRARLERLCAALDLDEASVDVRVEKEVKPRALDAPEQLDMLDRAVADARPTALIVDPLAEMRTGNESAAGPTLRLLDGLRGLRQLHGCAVIIVHHFRGGTGKVRGGAALRGSTALHGWLESGLYLRQDEDEEGGGSGRILRLETEQRDAAGRQFLVKRPSSDEGPFRWELLDADEWDDGSECAREASPDSGGGTDRDRVLRALLAAGSLPTVAAVAKAAKMRTERGRAALAALLAEHAVAKGEGGYRLGNVIPFPEEPTLSGGT